MENIYGKSCIPRHINLPINLISLLHTYIKLNLNQTWSNLSDKPGDLNNARSTETRAQCIPKCTISKLGLGGQQPELRW